MTSDALQLGTTVRLPLDFAAARERAIAALKVEGFGVLTEIDVQRTFKEKLGVDFRPYAILGACNPALSHRALSVAPQIGLLLPCNVTVTYVDEGTTDISIVDPFIIMPSEGQPELQSVAEEASARLKRVAAALST